MRKLVLIAILWSFATQSLALAIAPGCDMTTQAPADTQMAGMDHSTHQDILQGTHHGMDHGSAMHDMPCCDTAQSVSTGPELSVEQCQLTCASGICSLAMVAQDPLMPPDMNTAPYPGASSSPIPPTTQNLLRPPRRA